MGRSTAVTGRLIRLAERGRQAAAAADSAIDWSVPIKPPAWLPRRGYVTAISQFYYGELATIGLCQRILPAIAEPAANRFVTSQIADEERHVVYYERYLRRVGAIGDIEEGVAMAYDGARAWRGSHLGAIIVSHVVLEGEGLRVQQLYSRWFPCPLFEQINALIARDEARHVAFGKIYLRETLRHMSLEERLEIFRWVRSLWFDCADAARREMPRSVSILVGGKWIGDRWRRQLRGLVDIGLIGEDELRDAERL